MEKYMDIHNQVAFSKSGIAKIVLCTYTNGSTRYAFFCADPTVKVDDLMVARSKHGFEVVKVRQIIDDSDPKAKYANNWVIGKVEDMMDQFADRHGKMCVAHDARKRLARVIKASRLHRARQDMPSALFSEALVDLLKAPLILKDLFSDMLLARGIEPAPRDVISEIMDMRRAALRPGMIIYAGIDPASVEGKTDTTVIGNFTIHKCED